MHFVVFLVLWDVYGLRNHQSAQVPFTLLRAGHRVLGPMALLSQFLNRTIVIVPAIVAPATHTETEATLAAGALTHIDGRRFPWTNRSDDEMRVNAQSEHARVVVQTGPVGAGRRPKGNRA